MSKLTSFDEFLTVCLKFQFSLVDRKLLVYFVKLLLCNSSLGFINAVVAKVTITGFLT